jgi:AcrR family transcriptional regulator
MTVAQRRPYHHGNLRSALLSCAERTLRDGGAGELSLREIARQVGVSHAAPRRHFADKQALLDALAQDGFERLGRELREAMDGAGEGFHARLLAVSQSYVRFATEHAALLELMYAGKHRPGADDSLREAGERAFEAPMSLIAAGQAAGEVVAGDPARVGVAAWAAVHGLASLVNSDLIDADALDERVAEAVALLVEGLRPR